MKQIHRFLLYAMAIVVVSWPSTASAQGATTCPTDQDACVVDYFDGSAVIVNALRNTILLDTLRPANRVYVLKRGGLYYLSDPIVNNGFHLRLEGETQAPVGETDFGPAVIQMVIRGDGSAPGRMITGQGPLTIKHAWLTGQDNAGSTTAYLPILMEASNVTVVFDHVVMERTNFALFASTGANNEIFITNSVMRNFVNSTQQWEGRGIRLEAGAKKLVIENTSFFNIGMTLIQSEALPIEYFSFVHNTVVNVGRTFQAGSIWKEAYIANNLFLNQFWHGEGSADYNNPDREDPVTGFFGIDELPSAFGDERSRRIVYANNAHWRDPAFATFYGDTIRAQPLVNSITQGRVDAADNFVMQANQLDVNPNMTAYTSGTNPLNAIVPSMWNVINSLRQGQTVTFGTSYVYDPDRDPQVFEGAGFVWPLPENFEYTNASLMTAGSNGLPLGDLNWYPSAKATWVSNREEYITALEALAGPVLVITPIQTVQAEDGTLTGDAIVDTFDGFSYYQMDGSGSIQWDFTLANAGAYDLNVWTNLRGNGTRGQRVIVNGVSIKDTLNYGEYIWDPSGSQGGGINPHVGIPNNEWVWTLIASDKLHSSTKNGLVLPAGANRIRIEPSWGYQNFAGIDVRSAGTETASVQLRAPDAVTTLVAPVCSEADFCPEGFKKVVMGADGYASSLSLSFNAPSSGNYFVKVFYQTPFGPQTATVSVNGTPLATALELAGVVDDLEGRNASSAEFALTEGTHTVTISTTGKFNMDAVQLLSIQATTSINRGNDLPDGYALSQNYPNPFNPSTSIDFTLPVSADVRLVVYNVLGQRVAVLANGMYSAGVHSVRFEAANLSSGTYLFRFETGNHAVTRKMTLLK